VTIPIETIVVPAIAAPLQNYATVDVHNLPHLKGLKLAHPISNKTFFGIDQYWNVVEDNIIRGPGPTAAKSNIGYLLSAPLPDAKQSSTSNGTILHVMAAHKTDEFQLERFWNLESIGIKHTEGQNDKTELLKQYQDTSIHKKENIMPNCRGNQIIHHYQPKENAHDGSSTRK
jgi:hypothetical protein